MAISNGNKHFPKVESNWTPEGIAKFRIMPPPELLQEVADELMQFDEFDLAVALRDTAARWEQPYGNRPSIWASRVEAALECELSGLSKTRLEVVLESVRRMNGAPAVFDPYELYAIGEILYFELRDMVGEVNLAKLANVRAELEMEVVA